jgi:hypothetical protein
MSSAAMKWARAQRVEHRGLTFLIATLAAVADSRGQTWRAQGTLAEQMAVSERSVRLWLQALEKLGVIQRARRSKGRGLGRSSDLIRLRLDRQFTLTRPTVRAILQPANPAACNGVSGASYNRQNLHLQPANPAGDKLRGSTEGRKIGSQEKLAQDSKSALGAPGGEKPTLLVVNGGRK